MSTRKITLINDTGTERYYSDGSVWVGMCGNCEKALNPGLRGPLPQNHTPIVATHTCCSAECTRALELECGIGEP